jgi:large subunit ribosomal protein L28
MITGKRVMSGNNVSHAKNRTRRKFLPNVQDTSVYSEILKRKIRIRVSAAGLRTLEHKGGLDAFLMNTAPTKVDPALRQLKNTIERIKARA